MVSGVVSLRIVAENAKRCGHDGGRWRCLGERLRYVRAVRGIRCVAASHHCAAKTRPYGVARDEERCLRKELHDGLEHTHREDRHREEPETGRVGDGLAVRDAEGPEGAWEGGEGRALGLEGRDVRLDLEERGGHRRRVLLDGVVGLETKIRFLNCI